MMTNFTVLQLPDEKILLSMKIDPKIVLLSPKLSRGHPKVINIIINEKWNFFQNHEKNYRLAIESNQSVLTFQIIVGHLFSQKRSENPYWYNHLVIHNMTEYLIMYSHVTYFSRIN